MTDKLLIAAGVLVAISIGPLVLRLLFLTLCVIWDVIFQTRSGVELYDSIYGAPEGNKESV